MAKKEEKVNIEYMKALDNATSIKVKVDEEMKKSFIAYAMAVNVSRAIPDVRDGLKPVHRRILFAMNDMGNTYDKPTKKCARIVGEVLGKYHPHGDSAVYDALVRLAQDFSVRCPLVDGQGNFGSVDGDPAAAQRYTEARLSKIAGELLRDIEKETVDFCPNFDDTLYLPAPDYPTGGILMGSAALKIAYKTGRGGVVLRAKSEIEEYANGTRTRIVVTELPYQVNKAVLIKTIATLVKDKKIDGISDIHEESDRFGMRIVIDIKKEANAQVVLNSLYKHTQLQVSNGITLLALADGQPKIMGLKEILSCYIAHQKEVIVRRTKFDLEKAEERHHIIKGLVIAQDNIDRVVEIIKKSDDRYDAQEKLINEFYLTEKQAGAILDMRLARLTSLEVTSLHNELNELEKLIEELKSIIASPAKVANIIKTEMSEIKEKYADPRRTEISLDYSDINIGDLIEKEDVVVSMTHFGYVKRLPVNEYHAQKRGGKGVTAHKPKEEDFVENMFITNTHDDLLFFTNFGKVYSIKGYEVPEAQKTARGRAIVNLLQLGDGEKVTTVIPRKENARGYLFMATKRGLVKKTDIQEFDSIRKVGKIAISLNEGDELVGVALTRGYDEILIASSTGKCIRFAEEEVRAMGREAQGVRSMKIDKDEAVVDMTVVRSGCEVITVSENGYGKRSDITDYRLQSRAGKGIKAGTFNAKTGRLVNLKLVEPDDDIMVIADNGVVIRMRARDVSKIGRDTQGVRIMKFKDDSSKVVCVANTPPEAEELDGDEN